MNIMKRKENFLFFIGHNSSMPIYMCILCLNLLLPLFVQIYRHLSLQPLSLNPQFYVGLGLLRLEAH